MQGVRQHKWWGWGDEGVSFRIEDKPKFAPYVKEQVKIDLDSLPVQRPQFSDLDVPASQLGDELREALTKTLDEQWVVTDDEVRVGHAFGKGVRDLVRVRRGDFGRLPDVVVYPSDEDDVIAIMDAALAADAVVIPYGGGSNIVAALEAEPGETRQVVSVDMGRMNKLLELDAESGLARFQAGALGPEAEAQINEQGFTLGHFPDSFEWSSVGGWIATRSSGAQSDKYGDIADITRGLRMVMPASDLGDRTPGTLTQVLDLSPLPSASSGPSVREMVLGSEGRLGIITEAWLNVHPIAKVREIQAYFYPSYAAGVGAAEQITRSNAHPIMVRVSDPNETQFSMATGKKSSTLGHTMNQAVQKFMELKKWDLTQICISFVGYEGSPTDVNYQKAQVGKIVRRNGGFGVGKGPGTLYDQKKFDIPQIRDFLLDRGVPADVSETATPWSKVLPMYQAVRERVNATLERIGIDGFIMCHVSHSYHSGATQYFTFAVADLGEQQLDSYDAIKQVVQQTFVELGGTVSHHHGVGEEHSPWMAQDISEAGVHLQQVLFDGADPGHNLNPGKIIHQGKPGVSTNSTGGAIDPTSGHGTNPAAKRARRSASE